MPFITLHTKGKDQNNEVVVNTDNIIDMRDTLAGGTIIHTTGYGGDRPYSISVVQPLEVVVDTIKRNL